MKVAIIFSASKASLALLLLAALLECRSGAVVINEVMYHPPSEDTREEYIELFNPGAADVDLSSWHFSGGIEFLIPEGTRIPPGGFLVIAADASTFSSIHPEVTNVVGNWNGILGNTRQNLELENKSGRIMDAIRYADEGDWAQRVRGELDWNHYGWAWFAEHDGLGKSLELIHAGLPNEHGQNWASSSMAGGTPGRVNSVAASQLAPMILEVTHFPPVPRSTNQVTVSARILDQAPNGVSVTLFYRIDATPTNTFTELAMRDDGINGDSVGGDGVFAVRIPAMTNNAVVEFYLHARNSEGFVRKFPSAARQIDLTLANTCNLLYQVDDATVTSQPLYKLIMTEAERAELARIGNGGYPGESLSDAQMNATFISIDASGTEVKYLVGIRNRGHGSRNRKPNNYRVNFRSDEKWKGVEALNLNSQYTFLQQLGAVLALKSRVPMGYSRPVQVLVNNQNLVFTGGTSRTYGYYVANENLDGDWIENHFPLNDGGNIYRGIRDLGPADLSYRGEDKNLYTNSYFKVTNRSKDDWSDLIELTRVLSDSTNEMNEAEVRQIADIEQWMRHLALMALFDSRETGLNTGHGDDYFMYRGLADPRFQLVAYDLDTILGEGSATPGVTGTLFGSTNMPVFKALLEYPPFRAIYFQTLDELLRTTFSQEQFEATADQSLRGYVPDNVRDRMKTWMAGRREFVRGFLATNMVLEPLLPRALLSSAPRSRTPVNSASFMVSGEGVTHYQYRVNDGVYGPEIEVSNPIWLLNLQPGTYSLFVLGRNAEGIWQEEPTASQAWVVDPAWPAVRINEVLASNRAAVEQAGRFPDLIELHNEGSSSLDLEGYILTRQIGSPSQFLIPAGTTLQPGGYLVLVADNASGTHFQFDAEGDALFLLAPNGAVLDEVRFGSQITDLSLNRQGRDWIPGPPTFPGPNQFLPLGNPTEIKINEWLAAGSQSTVAGDFLEVYNASAFPVDLGGLHLSDQPIGNPARHAIPQLTFVQRGGYLAFRTDTGSSRAHFLPFGLSSEYGEIALFEGELVLDHIVYGPQQPGISEGRTPNGGNVLAAFVEPTPGAPNGLANLPPMHRIIALLPMDAVWHYSQSGNEPPSAWNQPAFDDTAWASGAALLADEDDPLPETVRTQLETANEKRAFYFRTRFFLDPNLVVSGLMVSHIIDDGAIFYLNGVEAGSRFNILPGPVSSTTLASRAVSNARLEGPFPLPVDALLPGENLIAIQVHQESDSSSDLVFGLSLEALVYTNSLNYAGVVINEVLASNRTLRELDGSLPDYIEFYNPSANAVDLAGMSLSDTPSNPTRFVFPSGTIIAPESFLVLRCDQSTPAGPSNVAFNLKAAGGSIYLYAPEGSQLLSVVHYGFQAADWSISAVPDGSTNWVLSVPSFGLSNRPTPLAPVSGLKVNEWLANPPAGQDDWFELYNLGVLPVPLGGLHLSDSTVNRAKFAIPPLSFIGVGTGGFQKFVADENTEIGPDHVSFRLSASGESLVLSTGDGITIDAVQFGPQQEGISQGRLPDGADAILSFPNTPTPGGPNFLPLFDDSDGDGLPDAWEDEHGFAKNDPADALLDADRDGLTNLDEYRVGTNPNQSGSRLQLVLSMDSPGQIKLEFVAVAGRSYAIAYSEFLTATNWAFLDLIPPQLTTTALSVALPATAGEGFYRLVVLP